MLPDMRHLHPSVLSDLALRGVEEPLAQESNQIISQAPFLGYLGSLHCSPEVLAPSGVAGDSLLFTFLMWPCMSLTSKDTNPPSSVPGPRLEGKVQGGV